MSETKEQGFHESPKDAIKAYESKIVTKGWERPARRDGTCFYCHSAIGTNHKDDCAALKRWVVVEYNIQIVEAWPEHASADEITHRLNNGSWCASNLLERLGNLDKDAKGGCLCPFVIATCKGNAPMEMLDAQGVSPLLPEGE